MFERTKARALPLMNQAADSAPVVTACCNACRACATTQITGLAMAGLAGLGLGIRRLMRRAIAYRERSETSSS